MGGASGYLEAPTKTELRKLVQEFTKSMKAAGLEDIRLGWDPARVVKTKDGYKIRIWAHS